MPQTPDLTLTAAERDRFNKAVTDAGLEPDPSWSNVINVAESGPIPSSFITTASVATLDDLNAIIGVPYPVFPDGTSGGGSSPEPITDLKVTEGAEGREALATAITPAQHRHLRRAADAYVFGDSSQPSGNASLINAALFPIDLTVIVAQSLTLAPGTTLSLSGDYVLLILGSLNIGAGASISSTANTVINAQVAFSAND
jgi:hypothetical protein